MLKRISTAAVLAALSFVPAYAVEEHHGFLTGSIVKLDAVGKTAVIKLDDGTEHTLHFVKRTAVHGAHAAAAGSMDVFHGLKEGGRVVVHYSAKGTEETAEEVDNVGRDGLKSADVTVVHIDRGAKTMAVKTAAGSEETFRLTDNAVKDAGTDIAQGSEKSAKVTVYYSEEGGRKVAHFFRRAL